MLNNFIVVGICRRRKYRPGDDVVRVKAVVALPYQIR